MIRYDLVCTHGHGFDGWFRSSADFDAQNERRLVNCPVCGADEVRKALMAPALRTRDVPASQAPVPTPVEAAGEPAAATSPALPVPVGLFPPEAAEMIAKLREIKQKLTANSENVGDRFPEEARKIHYGDAPERPVHGRATPEEAKALVEEGVEILPLPVLPDERN